jgi:hypothetical protein
MIQKLQTCENIVRNINLLLLLKVDQFKCDPKRRSVAESYTAMGSKQCKDAWSARTSSIIIAIEKLPRAFLEQHITRHLNDQQIAASAAVNGTHSATNLDFLILFLRWVALIFEVVFIGYEALFEHNDRLVSDYPISDAFLMPWLTQFDCILDKALDIIRLVSNFYPISKTNIKKLIKWLNKPPSLPLVDSDLLSGIEEAESLIRDASKQWMAEYYRCIDVEIENAKLGSINDDEGNLFLRLFENNYLSY